MQTGNAEAGSILSFAASVFGFGTGWTSYAADYTVYQPRSANRVRVFAWTFGGLILPLCFTEMLGLAVATATVADAPNIYADGYKSSNIGGLLAAVLFPPLGRFGQFCLVVLALSIIANNCPNIYSLTFSLQVMGRWTQAVPRFIWTFIGTLVYCAIAIPGYSHFQSVLENFMLLIVRPSPPLSKNSLPKLTFPPPPSGLLARHLRRHRPPRALPLQTRHLRLRPQHLHHRLPPPPRHRRNASLLLRRLRRRHGHGAEVVYGASWTAYWAARVWGRCWVSACVCVCGGELCGVQGFGGEVVWAVGGLLWDGTLGSGEGAVGCLYASNEFDELEISLSPDSHGHYYIKSVFPTSNPLSPFPHLQTPFPPPPNLLSPPPLDPQSRNRPTTVLCTSLTVFICSHRSYTAPVCVCQNPLGSDLCTYGGCCGIGYEDDGGGDGGDDGNDEKRSRTTTPPPPPSPPPPTRTKESNT